MKLKILMCVVVMSVACAGSGQNPMGPSPVNVAPPSAPSPVVIKPPTNVVAPPSVVVPPTPVDEGPIQCKDPRTTLLTNLSADGKQIAVRNDGNCDYPVVLVGWNVTSYDFPMQGQVLVEVVESTIKAGAPWSFITLTKPLNGCYQTDFWYQMSAGDVVNTKYPPFKFNITLNHGLPPIGCDPPPPPPPIPVCQGDCNPTPSCTVNCDPPSECKKDDDDYGHNHSHPSFLTWPPPPPDKCEEKDEHGDHHGGGHNNH